MTRTLTTAALALCLATAASGAGAQPMPRTQAPAIEVHTGPLPRMSVERRVHTLGPARRDLALSAIPASLPIAPRRRDVTVVRGPRLSAPGAVAPDGFDPETLRALLDGCEPGPDDLAPISRRAVYSVPAG